MTSMTVRDVRLHWPKAEKALATGEEIVITRDSKPVARLLPFLPGATEARPRFDCAAHIRQLQRFWRKRPAQPASDVLLSRDRDE